MDSPYHTLRGCDKDDRSYKYEVTVYFGDDDNITEMGFSVDITQASLLVLTDSLKKLYPDADIRTKQIYNSYRNATS